MKIPITEEQFEERLNNSGRIATLNDCYLNILNQSLTSSGWEKIKIFDDGMYYIVYLQDKYQFSATFIVHDDDNYNVKLKRPGKVGLHFRCDAFVDLLKLLTIDDPTVQNYFNQ